VLNTLLRPQSPFPFFLFQKNDPKTDLKNWRKAFPVNKEHFYFGHKLSLRQKAELC